MGDLGNDIKIYGGKLYAVINVSNKIEVMDKWTGKRIKVINVPNCRYLAFHKDKAYINQRSWFGDGTKYIWIRILDNQGNKLKEYPILSDGYDQEILNEDGSLSGEGYDFWFPAMPLFQDVNGPEICLNQVMMNAEESCRIDLNEKIADPDNLLVGITKVIEYDETQGLISAELQGQFLVIKSLGNMQYLSAL